MKTKSTVLFILLVFNAFFCRQAVAQVNTQDSLALVDLYNSTNGASWTHHNNWLTGPLATWYGINADTRVRSIDLEFNNLKGTLPSSLGKLSELNYFNLNGNRLLTGSIPPEFGNLTKLSSFILSQDALTGSIPPELGNLTNTEEFSLWSNSLTGSIPPELGNLANVTYFVLSANQLSGNIPVTLSNLTNVKTLSLSGNKLTGGIPVALSTLPDISQLNLSHNQLSGAIPPELGKLTKLFWLSLNYNELTGSIPPELGKLTNLIALELNNNQLSGNIPPELGDLVNLTGFVGFNLSNNQLTGSIPASLGNFVNLQGNFDLSNNKLSGKIPAELSNIGKNGQYYLRFFLNNNQLTGSIPAELGNISTLSLMYLNNNELSGSIPSSFGKLTNLTDINLRNNKLFGEITDTFGKLVNRHRLYLDHNKFKGGISTTITTLPLDSLDLSYNHFTFDGMELIAQKFPFAVYNHQAFIKGNVNGSALSVYAGGTLSNNTYSWFRVTKHGFELLATKQGDSIFFPSQNGIYVSKVTNAVATELILKSDTIKYRGHVTTNSVFNLSEDRMQEDEQQSFSVYPNPANNILHIESKYKITVSLIDLSGKTIMTDVINKRGIINVSKINAGVYYLKNNNAGISVKVIILK